MLIAAPRGFCAGVDRAIQIVELALERFGAPVYVRHEIVHNRFVVERLRELGAVFVDELDEVPDDRPVVFSAHGVPKSVPAAAQDRGLTYVDATCPLVSKVHRQAQRLIEEGRHILFIGHAGHPEVIGTFGQVPAGSMTLVETVEDVAAAAGSATSANLAFLTQTTLSVDDTAAIVEALKARFPDDPSAAQRGHLLCDLEPAGGGQGDRRRVRPDAGDRRAQQQQLAAARRSRRADGRSGPADRARGGHRLGLARRAARPSASPPALPRRKCWFARCSTRFGERFDVTEEIADHTPERMTFKLPRELVA